MEEVQLPRFQDQWREPQVETKVRIDLSDMEFYLQAETRVMTLSMRRGRERGR